LVGDSVVRPIRQRSQRCLARGRVEQAIDRAGVAAEPREGLLELSVVHWLLLLKNYFDYPVEKKNNF
jgi:hypothetical protein